MSSCDFLIFGLISGFSVGFGGFYIFGVFRMVGSPLISSRIEAARRDFDPFHDFEWPI